MYVGMGSTNPSRESLRVMVSGATPSFPLLVFCLLGTQQHVMDVVLRNLPPDQAVAQ